MTDLPRFYDPPADDAIADAELNHDTNNEIDSTDAEVVDMADQTHRTLPDRDASGEADAPVDSLPDQHALARNPSAVHHETSRTVAAMNKLLKLFTPMMERLRRRAGKSKARVLQLRATMTQRVAAANTALLELEAAQQADEHARRHPDRHAVRRVGTTLTVLVGCAVAIVAFVIDRVQLRAVFSFENVGTVTLIALMVGIGQAVTAHLAGDARSDEQFADKSSVVNSEWRTFRAVRLVSIGLGLGSNLVLGMLRGARGGGITVAALLTAAGIALWLAGAWTSYGHASPTATALVRGLRRYMKAHARAAAVILHLGKADERHKSDVDAVRAKSDEAVKAFDTEVSHLHGRLATLGLPPYTPEMPRQYHIWKWLAEPTSVDEHTLPTWAPPLLLDPNRRFGGSHSGLATPLASLAGS